MRSTCPSTARRATPHTPAAAAWRWTASLKLEVNAAGGLNKDFNQWKGSVDTLDIGGAFSLKLQNRMNLEAGAEAFPPWCGAGA